MQPLAERLRPQTLAEVFGQTHLLGEDKILSRILQTGKIPNMVFYGPPGTGKTTVANLAAQMSEKRFYKLNATNACVGDIKEIINDLNKLFTTKGVLLYLDEIQHFNKKQQQALLEFMENGQITLIASTTENPYHYLYNALLSRSTVLEFQLLTPAELVCALQRAIDLLQKEIDFTYEADLLMEIAQVSGGDVRRALNSLELLVSTAPMNNAGALHLTKEWAKQCTQKALNYDKDDYYDLLSALQKSVRGSDADAALHYLARLLKAGDLAPLCRRLLVMAAEDIGLAYPQAISIVKSCTDAAWQLGLPEARLPLAQAVLLLAIAPKSNSVLEAIDRALSDLESKSIGSVPAHLRDAHYQGAKALGRGKEYKYPHNYIHNYVQQQYLPDSLCDAVYYRPGKNKIEEKIEKYWKEIKK